MHTSSLPRGIPTSSVNQNSQVNSSNSTANGTKNNEQTIPTLLEDFIDRKKLAAFFPQPIRESKEFQTLAAILPRNPGSAAKTLTAVDKYLGPGPLENFNIQQLPIIFYYLIIEYFCKIPVPEHIHKAQLVKLFLQILKVPPKVTNPGEIIEILSKDYIGRESLYACAKVLGKTALTLKYPYDTANNSNPPPDAVQYDFDTVKTTLQQVIVQQKNQAPLPPPPKPLPKHSKYCPQAL